MSDDISPTALPITAIGAATLHGDTHADTNAVLAKTRPILRRRRDFIGGDFKPLRAGFRADHDLNQDVAGRIWALATRAIADLAANCDAAPLQNSGIGLVINLPEDDPAFALPSDLGARLVDHVAQTLSAPVLRQVVQRAGSAGPGGFLAKLMDAGWDGLPLVVLAVDSMGARSRLAAQLDRGDLMSDANPYGLIPGEAAVAMLCAQGPAIAQILGAGSGAEATKEDDAGESDYTGLSNAWWGALGPGETQINHLWTDWNNGRYRAAQMSYAMVRTTPRLAQGIEPEHVAMQFGDTGAAAQLLALTRALAVAQPGETALVSAHSRWSGACSALMLRRPALPAQAT